MKFFEKVKNANGERKIYVCGMKIFSYKKDKHQVNESFFEMRRKKKEYQKGLLQEKGVIFLNKDNFVTPDGIHFTNLNSMHEVYEVFIQNEYAFFLNAKTECIVFDVGMNNAASTLYFASKPNCKKIYAFEPFYPTYKNGLKNINLRNH